jgi:hypothetical protein
MEGLEERLIEILYGMGFLKFSKEGGTVDAIEDSRSPIEDFGKIQVFELTGVSNLMK